MRILVIVLSIFILISNAYAQLPKNYNRNFKLGKVVNFNGHEIKKTRGNYLTNIWFQTKEDFVAEIKSKSIEEMWTPQQEAETLRLYENYTGFITVYLGRLTLEGANAENFTIIIANIDGKEIERFTWDWDIAEVDQFGNCYNFLRYNIKSNFSTPFKVFIIDNLGGEGNKVHEFEVLN